MKAFIFSILLVSSFAHAAPKPVTLEFDSSDPAQTEIHENIVAAMKKAGAKLKCISNCDEDDGKKITTQVECRVSKQGRFCTFIVK